MNNILILFAHPRADDSIVQKSLRAAVETEPGIELRDLYAHYPDFAIDVRAEQQALEKARVIVIQCPFYWYSVPALVKEWLDLVLDYGWAYGPGGEALKGKILLNAVSTAGSPEAYSPQGRNRLSVAEYLNSFEQTALTCGMQWHPPFVVHQGRKLDPAALKTRAEEYRALLTHLRDGAAHASG